MAVQELNREQLQQLKIRYIGELADEGIFGEIVYGNPSITEPSYDDYANVDELIPDDVIVEHFDGVEFVADDFWN